ncbi:hypothetical protein HDU88_005872 [Geranomyces variabilis]|nr:hypothetical protein HDU88_005872 [Geranomyces variabilis]
MAWIKETGKQWNRDPHAVTIADKRKELCSRCYTYRRLKGWPSQSLIDKRKRKWPHEKYADAESDDAESDGHEE